MASADDVLSDRACGHRLPVEAPRQRIKRPEVLPARRLLATIPVLESNITIVALRNEMDVGWME